MKILPQSRILWFNHVFAMVLGIGHSNVKISNICYGLRERILHQPVRNALGDISNGDRLIMEIINSNHRMCPQVRPFRAHAIPIRFKNAI